MKTTGIGSSGAGGKVNGMYFQRTIGKAFKRLEGVGSVKTYEAPTHDQLDSPGARDAGGAQPHTATARALLCEQISAAIGVRVLRIVNVAGQEPTYRVDLETAKIGFASVDQLVVYQKFRMKIASAADHMVPKIKAWEQVAPDDAQRVNRRRRRRRGGSRGFGADYAEGYLSETPFIDAEEELSYQTKFKPAVYEGQIAVCSIDLQQHINKARGEDRAIKEVTAMLSALGVERKAEAHAVAGSKPVAFTSEHVPARKPYRNQRNGGRCPTILMLTRLSAPSVGETTPSRGIPHLRTARNREDHELNRQIRRAVDRFGKDSVLVTSFSRAAAAELAGRDLPLSSDRVGTLHSHCWHALGRPEIAEVHVDEWNRQNPHLRITPAKKERKLEGEDSEEESASDLRSGDYWLSELDRCRGMMQPAEVWPATLRDFAARWNRHKASRRLLDFCDLIGTAHREIRIAPKRPDVIFADEAQDLNPMQLNLVRRWGENAQYFIIAADDDQTIYSWCGATPDAVLDPDIPEDHKIFLKQSHRVPRVVHARANRLIRQVTRRQEKDYEPRPEEGVCLNIYRGGYKSPDYWILKALTQHIESGQSVMLLASCSFMLHPVISVLQQWGIPFHNRTGVRWLLESTAARTKRIFCQPDSFSAWFRHVDPRRPQAVD